MAAAAAFSGPNGFAEIARFRISPIDFLRKHQEDEETFIHNILKLFFKDTVQASVKIHLLNVIHEYAPSLINSTERAEEIAASLLNVFTQSSSTSPLVFKGQILVTITSLALQYDFQDHCLDMFVTLVETLLDVVCHTNKAADGHLRSVGCSCLQELETVLPCVLQNKLEYVYQLAQMENGTAAQAYSILLVIILRNALLHLKMQPKEELSSNVLGDLLTNRTEPLKPFILPRNIYDCSIIKNYNSEETLEGIENRELRRLVSFMLEQAHLFTVPSQVLLLRHLAFIVKNTPDIPPSTFKWISMRFSRSYDIAYVSLLFLYQELFGGSLVDQEEIASVFRSLALCVNHPGFSLTHRMLPISILNSLTQPDEDSGWSRFLAVPQLYRLFPRVFDGCDLQLKKLELLSRLLPHCLPDEDVEELLCSCVSLLHQSVTSGLGGRYATCLFRAFYLFYLNHPDRDSVESIKWMLIRLGENHDRLALRVLNFVEAAQEIHPNVDFDREILLSMVTSLTRVSEMDKNPKQLANSLLVLQRIAGERSIDPEVIISYLQHLVGRGCAETLGSWELGSQTLSVCRMVLAHHSVDRMYEGLGYVLHSMMMFHPDVDIRDRAGFYYITMSSIAPKKLQSLLAETNTSVRDTQGLASMVNRSSELSSAKPIFRFPTPLLKLTRITPDKIKIASKDGLKSVASSDIIQVYNENLELLEEARFVELDYYLHFRGDKECDLDELYALVLHMEASSSYADIQDIKVPILKREESSCPGDQCCRVTITLEPREPGPTSLTGESVFTSRDGQTLLSSIEGDTIILDDIWRPIPCICERSALFPELWKKFTHADQTSSRPAALESLVYLGIDEKALKALLEGPWKDLQVNVNKTLATTASAYGPENYVRNDARDIHENGSQKSQTSLHHLGIFLPPKYHVLMEIVPRGSHVVAYMVTDKAELLALMADYLKQFESSIA